MRGHSRQPWFFVLPSLVDVQAAGSGRTGSQGPLGASQAHRRCSGSDRLHGLVQPEQEVETAYREAAETARGSATPERAEVVDLVSGLLREPNSGYAL